MFINDKVLLKKLILNGGRQNKGNSSWQIKCAAEVDLILRHSGALFSHEGCLGRDDTRRWYSQKACNAIIRARFVSRAFNRVLVGLSMDVHSLGKPPCRS